MGATVTTFCNETKLFIYTELSVVARYYWDDLAPNSCTDFKVGRVWFTATAKLSENKAGALYFPISETRAAGIPGMNLDYVDLTPDEAKQIITSSYDILYDNYQTVYDAVHLALEKLSISMPGYYADKDKKLIVAGGPRAAIRKEHPHFGGKYITIIPANYPALEFK